MSAANATIITLPALSAPIADFISYIDRNPDTPIGQLVEPYKAFEHELRKVYAQERDHDFAKDGLAALVPLYNGHEDLLRIRARVLSKETEAQRAKYIMPLSSSDRKKNGSPAMVSSIEDFQANFNIFSELALADLNWDNVVCAGSAVTTALLPVPAEHKSSKKDMRTWYHEKFAPASDVDLFLYGLSEEQAVEKIKQIEKAVKDCILTEVLTVRTKHAITIVSHYPTRHIQIVLRLYDSVSQILTGFDVDCACVAYDGSQVYASPRAIAAFLTQCNTVDLSRRSPSYENRLSKYSHRGFEVHWSALDRSRIDPTIFERSFRRTQGLARLLVLEKMPKAKDRDEYMDQRRRERGRPDLERDWRSRRTIHGNIKDSAEDEVPEWVEEEQSGGYHTMVIPYGPKHTASGIMRMLYTKDILLNAEWNQAAFKKRHVYLHRHPCFFGTAEEVIQDCCEYCPKPVTDEEEEVAENESKHYVSGRLAFISDNPGRQEIGSFNPTTNDEFTTMAYIGETALLCQAIVDGNLRHVQEWCKGANVDVNTRDCTGRTPLHLATMVSNVEIVQCLVDHGARLIARLVDGRTALHIAAAIGSTDIIRILMNKSSANEALEDEKTEMRRKAKRATRGQQAQGSGDEDEAMIDVEDVDSDNDSEPVAVSPGSEDVSDSMTMGSFVKMKVKDEPEDFGTEGQDEPDIYEVDVVAWDHGLTPLHCAILEGHHDVIEMLISDYGANVLVPVKLVTHGTNEAKGAILSLLLCLNQDIEQAKSTATLLLKLGAKAGQSDSNHITALHSVAASGKIEILDLLLQEDLSSRTILNNLGSCDGYSIDSPLSTAVARKHPGVVTALLAAGAKPTIEYDAWVKQYTRLRPYAKTQSEETLRRQYHQCTKPVLDAVARELVAVVENLLANGADVNTLNAAAHDLLLSNNRSYYTPQTLLDMVRSKLKALEAYEGLPTWGPKKPPTLQEEREYTKDYHTGSYMEWTAACDYKRECERLSDQRKTYNDAMREANRAGSSEKKAAIDLVIGQLKRLDKVLVSKGAKPFYTLYPDKPESGEGSPFYHQNKEEIYHNTWTISGVNSDRRKLGCMQLFEIVWSDQLSTEDKIKAIKRFTFGSWGKLSDFQPELQHMWTEGDMEAPLPVSIQDPAGFTLFAVAALKGDYVLAEAILNICKLQWRGPSAQFGRAYRLRDDGSDEDSDMDSEDDEHELPIIGEYVSDEFTIDNLAELQETVSSEVSPADLLHRACRAHRFDGVSTNKGAQTRVEGRQYNHDTSCSALEYAIDCNNLELTQFVLRLGADLAAAEATDEDDIRCCVVSEEVFSRAISLGHTTILSELIRSTGAGLPINALIENHGLEIQTRPKYYQGLTVGGKKKKEWAQAPGESVATTEEKTSPVLRAAYFGVVESVEWLMSDAPTRHYKTWAETNAKDKRVKTLHRSKGGFDRMLGKWLHSSESLTLHAALLGIPELGGEPRQLEVVKHLLSVLPPEALSTTSDDGYTPLHLAIYTKSVALIKIILEAGASLRQRDKYGRNPVHILVMAYARDVTASTPPFAEVLSLFDAGAVREMIAEKSSAGDWALTPLALWLSWTSWQSPSQHTQAVGKDGIDVLRTLASYSNGKELCMINGEGNLPLHTAVDKQAPAIIKHLIVRAPNLLYRESATGRTPLEMAHEAYTASLVDAPPDASPRGRWHGTDQSGVSITNQPIKDFAPPGSDDVSDLINGRPSLTERQRTTLVWELCQQADADFRALGNRPKRILVTLNEANEVARRLAQRVRDRASDDAAATATTGSEEEGSGSDNSTKSDTPDGDLIADLLNNLQNPNLRTADHFGRRRVPLEI